MKDTVYMETTFAPLLLHTTFNSSSTTSTFNHSTTFNTTTTTTTCPHAQVNVGSVAHTVFMMFLLLMSVGGNCVVVLAVCLSNRLVADRSTFYFVASLACSDMVMAMAIPYNISSVLHEMYFCFNLSACYTQHIIGIFSNMASMLGLFLVSTDRFIAVHMPYKYQTLLTKGRSKRLILISWLIAALWSIFGIFRWGPTSPGERLLVITVNNFQCKHTNNNYHVASFCIYFILLFLMAGIYVRIIQIVIDQIGKMKDSTPKRQSIIDKQSKSRWSLVPLMSRTKEIKAAKTILIVYFAFCLCWLPSATLTVIDFVSPSYFIRISKTTSLGLWFAFVDILPMVNTMVNPIIYSFSNAQFRNAVIDIWRKFQGKAPKRRADSYFNSNSNDKRLSFNSNRGSLAINKGSPRGGGSPGKRRSMYTSGSRIDIRGSLEGVLLCNADRGKRNSHLCPSRADVHLLANGR